MVKHRSGRAILERTSGETVENEGEISPRAVGQSTDLSSRFLDEIQRIHTQHEPLLGGGTGPVD